MNLRSFIKYFTWLLATFVSLYTNLPVKSDELIKSNLYLGMGASGALNFEPFRKLNLSISAIDEGKNCDIEICLYEFSLKKLGRFAFPLPSVVKAKHMYENHKLTILLSQTSDIYDGILEIQSCPKNSTACKCTVNHALQEINARKNLPEAVSFSADYASKEFRCVKLTSRYQWRK